MCGKSSEHSELHIKFKLKGLNFVFVCANIIDQKNALRPNKLNKIQSRNQPIG